MSDCWKIHCHSDSTLSKIISPYVSWNIVEKIDSCGAGCGVDCSEQRFYDRFTIVLMNEMISMKGAGLLLYWRMRMVLSAEERHQQNWMKGRRNEDE